MSLAVKRAPKFTGVVGGDLAPENSSIVIVVSTADDTKFALEFEGAIVPNVVSALMGMLGKLIGALPAEKRPAPAMLRSESFGFVTSDEGDIGLNVKFAGGAEFNFGLPTNDLPKFRAMIDDAIAASQLSKKH